MITILQKYAGRRCENRNKHFGRQSGKIYTPDTRNIRII